MMMNLYLGSILQGKLSNNLIKIKNIRYYMMCIYHLMMCMFYKVTYILNISLLINLYNIHLSIVVHNHPQK